MRPTTTSWLRRLVVVAGIAVLPSVDAAGQAKHVRAEGWPHRVGWEDRGSAAVHEDLDVAIPVIAAAARQRGVVDSAIAMARRHLRMPRLLFVARSCGKPNAYYFTRSGEVVVCFEMLVDAYRLLTLHENASPTDAEADGKRLADAVGFARFLFAHELGHALIHRYRIPVVGEEEAAADQFALWLLSEDRAGPELAIAHYMFVLLSVNEEWTDERVVDPHGLDLRRAQRIACWLASIDELRPATTLTESERRHCAATVAQARHAWGRLLAPYRVRRRAGSKPYFVASSSRDAADAAVTARARRRVR